MIPNTPEAWSERAATVADPYEAVRWSRTGQEERFAAVLAALDPQPGDSLLDFGCGTGALAEMIPDGVIYVGYDWAPAMIERAQLDRPGLADHSGFKFVTEGFESASATYDLIACIGPFNLPDGWSKADTWETLAALWARARRALAVSLYAGTDADCLIYDAGEVAAFAAGIGVKKIALSRPRPNDLLAVFRR